MKTGRDQLIQPVQVHIKPRPKKTDKNTLPFLPPVCYNARVSCAMRVGALLREDPSPSNHSISGYSEVGIAPGLGVPWRYPGQGKAKRRKAL